MVNEWRTVSLGELFRVKHGFAFKSEYFTDEPQDTVLVTPGNFAIGGGFQDGKRKYYKGQLPEDYVLKPGQIVVTMTDLSKESDTLGYAASIPNDSTIWLHNQRVGLLEFKTAIPTEPRFFEYLLRTHEYRSWIVGSATGTTVKHTAPERIESFATRLPPIEEQRAIAHILGTLDDKIELNRTQNETLETMARTLFKAWFVDFEPVRAKMEGRWQRGQSLPGLPAHLYDIFPDRLVESELGEIPEGWEIAKVETVLKRLPAKVRYTKNQVSSHGKIPVFEQGASLVLGFHDGEAFYQANADDPAFVFGDHTCITKLSCRPFDVSQNVIPLRGQGRPTMWVYYAINEKQKFEEYRRHWMELITKDLIVAPSHICLEFSNWVTALHIQMEQSEQETHTLAQLRDTLLPKLISGELRVANAEHIVGATI